MSELYQVVSTAGSQYPLLLDRFQGNLALMQSMMYLAFVFRRAQARYTDSDPDKRIVAGMVANHSERIQAIRHLSALNPEEFGEEQTSAEAAYLTATSQIRRAKLTRINPKSAELRRMVDFRTSQNVRLLNQQLLARLRQVA